MRKYIKVTRENFEFIKKAFGVATRCVQYALAFDVKKGQTDTAKRIRNLALQRGGVLTVEAPAAETIFTADGYARQEFDNGAVIVCDLHTGLCVLTDKTGKEVARIENATIAELGVLQAEAEKL